MKKERNESRMKPDYRLTLLVPVIILLSSAAFLVSGYVQTGEWFSRSIELRGGTQVSIGSSGSLDTAELQSSLSSEFGNTAVKELTSLSGREILITMDAGVDTDEVLAFLESTGMETSDASVAAIGPALGEAFWAQAQMAIVLAFAFMGVIVLIIFRTLVPSIAVILAALSDILVTLAAMQLLGIELTLAGMAALLMLIGYSIDTDILLTTRLLRTTEGHISKRVRSAFRTGMVMSGTTIAALLSLYLSAVSPVLSQIATVLLIGLVIDIINTWMQNATILRWHCERRGL
jgi:preprotein translocase subunit SecF